MWIIKRIIRKLFKEKTTENKIGNMTYSQSGEDCIVRFIFNSRNYKMKSYLDVGAYNPTYLSNTYAFYEQGINGLCIEPNPSKISDFIKKRPLDKILNVGVTSGKTGQENFYIFESDVLCTFSKEEADRMISECKEVLIEKNAIPVININELVSKEYQIGPDFISLDIEGFDYDILSVFDFEQSRPKVWCIETIIYSQNGKLLKDDRISILMKDKGYFAFADTFVNTIFVDQEWWNNSNK